MPIKEDIERILPDQVIKSLSERKVLVLVCAILSLFLVIILTLAILLGDCHLHGSNKDQSGAGCRTVDCLHAASWVMDNMDKTVNPCEDFYKYSCGGWEARNSIPPDHSEVSIVEQLEDEIDEKLREIIEKIPPSTTSATSAEGKLQIFFSSCIHEYGRGKDAGRTLVDLIQTNLKGWYVLNPETWNTDWDFQQALARVQGGLLVNVFFETWLEQDSRTKKFVLGIYYSGVGLQYMHYNNVNKAEVQDAYKDYMRRVAMLLVRDANVTLTPSEMNDRVEQFVNDAYGLETELAMMLQTTRQQKKLYQRVMTTVGVLQTNFTQLNWQNILTSMFDNLEVTADTQIRVSAPMYFDLLNTLIRNKTDLHIRDRVFNNYLVWRIMFKYSNELSWEYREAGFRFTEALYGENEWPPTWRTCLETVHYRLGSLLAMEFIKSHIAFDAKKQVHEMYTSLRKKVADRVLQLKWMDNVTSTRAYDKITTIKDIIGFSEIYYNVSLMESLHSNLEITKTASYFTNLLNLNKFQRRSRIQLFINMQSSIMDHAPMLGYTFNYWAAPFYQWYLNTLVVPAGVMLDPIYNPNRPKVFNYGILGPQIAAELFEGRYILSNGSYSNWWTNGTNNEYKKATNCFVKYFEQLTAGPFIVNGESKMVPVNGAAQTYRLMDQLGGIRVAFASFKDWMKENKKEEVLPVGLDMSPEQLFFVSSVQTKCFLRTDAYSYQRATSRMLPESMAVNSLLSHLPEFTESFQCPHGSAMRMTYQCETY